MPIVRAGRGNDPRVDVLPPRMGKAGVATRVGAHGVTTHEVTLRVAIAKDDRGLVIRNQGGNPPVTVMVAEAVLGIVAGGATRASSAQALVTEGTPAAVVATPVNGVAALVTGLPMAGPLPLRVEGEAQGLLLLLPVPAGVMPISPGAATSIMRGLDTVPSSSY